MPGDGQRVRAVVLQGLGNIRAILSGVTAQTDHRIQAGGDRLHWAAFAGEGVHKVGGAVEVAVRDQDGDAGLVGVRGVGHVLEGEEGVPELLQKTRNHLRGERHPLPQLQACLLGVVVLWSARRRF